VLGFITDSMIAVGIQRKALGLHPQPVWFYFSLGAPVWRMTGALFLAGIVIFVIALLTAGVCTVVWFAVGGLGGAALFLRVLDVGVVAAFIVYVVVRLLFFLPPVVVAESRIGLERAWVLGGHNFWRILMVAIAVVLPVAIVFHLLAWAIFGSAAGLRMAAGGSARELLRVAVLNYGAIGPFALLFGLLERIVLLGVANGAMASAYLAVTGHTPETAPPPA
jgi:hypothetical protein